MAGSGGRKTVKVIRRKLNAVGVVIFILLTPTVCFVKDVVIFTTVVTNANDANTVGEQSTM